MRRTPKFDREHAARIIAESIAGGEKATCDKHGLSRRTLQRWKKRLEGDALLAQLVGEKRALVEADWAADLPDAIRECITFVRERVPKLRTTPASLHVVAGAMKLLTDVAISRKLIDVRLARQARQAGEADRSGAGTGGNVVALRPQSAPADGVHPSGEPKIQGA